MIIRIWLPVLVTGIIGGILVVSYFVTALEPKVEPEISDWFNILAAVAFILGAGNLIRVHLVKLSRRSRDWPYSIVTLAGFFFTLIAGLLKIGVPDPKWQNDINTQGSLFNFAYDGMFAPLQSTMFSILAFFVASASYRAFRARNTEATLLLSAALIILLGRTFVGVQMTAWLPDQLQFLSIPSLSGWIMSVANLAGQRAILIGIALGVISTSLKVILGIERSYLGGRES